ncbi:MAG: hypothetical protein JSW47_23215 [Phycisphaerales bacterium]|nr:MAG: hypothetical protein JSW47_23215 [Phycisphaerales bacterium]
MIRQFEIPEGTPILLGAPAKPMDPSISDALAELISPIEGIVEAHLPQCYVPSKMKEPAQILVVVVDEMVEGNTVLEQIDQGLSRILPSGQSLDVWPMGKDNSLLDSIRAKGCQLAGSFAQS